MDYILGMITGDPLMIATLACTSGNPLNVAGNTIQKIEIVNQSWESIYVGIIV